MRKLKILSKVVIILLSITIIIFVTCQQPSGGVGGEDNKNDSVESNIIKTTDISVQTLESDGEDGGSIVIGSPESNIIKAVDTDGNVGYFSSIAVSEHNIYISYYDDTIHCLKFAKSIDGGISWSIQKIDSGINNEGKILPTSIALSGSKVYISYVDAVNRHLKLASSTDGGITWTIQIVDYYVDSGTSLAVFKPSSLSPDYLYISYFEGDKGLLKFAKSKNNGFSWERYTVDPNGGIFSSIAVCGLFGTHIYISYYDDLNDDLKFAKSTDGGVTWVKQTLDSSSEQIGLDTSIAITYDLSGDDIFISYFDKTNGDLKFAKSIDGGINWETEPIDSSGIVGRYNSIFVSGSYIYISYYNHSTGDLNFVKSTDREQKKISWEKYIIDSNGQVGMDTSIAVSGNYVYISYRDHTNLDLKFAKSITGGDTW